MTAVPGVERIASKSLDAANQAAKAAPATLEPTPAVPPPASVESVQKFRDVMEQQTRVVHANAGAGAHRPSAIGEIVHSQDQVVNDMAKSVHEFENNAKTMDQRQMTAEVVRMQFEMAETMMRIEMGVSFAQGGKGAVQNLMKNQ